MSTNVPEVIESLKASCSGNGIFMAKTSTSTVRELCEALDELVIHAVLARLVIFSVHVTSKL